MSFTSMTSVLLLLIPSRIALMETCAWMSLLKSSEPEPLVSHDVLDIDAESVGKSKSSSLLEPSLSLLKVIRVYSSCLIVNPPFFRIFEQFVGIDNLGELLLGPWIFFVAVGVVLPGPLLEGSLDLVFTGILVNSQHFVRVGDFFGFHVPLQEDKQ